MKSAQAKEQLFAGEGAKSFAPAEPRPREAASEDLPPALFFIAVATLSAAAWLFRRRME